MYVTVSCAYDALRRDVHVAARHNAPLRRFLEAILMWAFAAGCGGSSYSHASVQQSWEDCIGRRGPSCTQRADEAERQLTEMDRFRANMELTERQYAPRDVPISTEGAGENADVVAYIRDPSKDSASATPLPYHLRGANGFTSVMLKKGDRFEVTIVATGARGCASPRAFTVHNEGGAVEVIDDSGTHRPRIAFRFAPANCVSDDGGRGDAPPPK